MIMSELEARGPEDHEKRCIAPVEDDGDGT